MPPLTLNQAAREAGRSKATLLEAIRGGRLSAPKDELGRYQIDPAELFRVYPPTGRRPDAETATDPMPPTTETALLRQNVEFLERIIQGIESERNDLRRRLDAYSPAKARTGSAAGSHSEPERPPCAGPSVVMGCACRHPHWSRLCSMAGLWPPLTLILRAAKTNERSCWIIGPWFVGQPIAPLCF
jgi:hypothetical protein